MFRLRSYPQSTMTGHVYINRLFRCYESPPRNLVSKSQDKKKDPSKAPSLHNPAWKKVLRTQAPTALWMQAALLHRGPPDEAPPCHSHLLQQTVSRLPSSALGLNQL